MCFYLTYQAILIKPDLSNLTYFPLPYLIVLILSQNSVNLNILM